MMARPVLTKPIYGVMAEFDSPTSLVNAARAAREKGYRKLDAYTPFPIEELSDALHLHKNKLPLIVLMGGIAGGIGGYLLQYFITVIYYLRNDDPVRVAGRRARLAGPLRAAHAVPPHIQCAALRAGQPQPLLPLH